MMAVKRSKRANFFYGLTHGPEDKVPADLHSSPILYWSGEINLWRLITKAKVIIYKKSYWNWFVFPGANTDVKFQAVGVICFDFIAGTVEAPFT